MSPGQRKRPGGDSGASSKQLAGCSPSLAESRDKRVNSLRLSAALVDHQFPTPSRPSDYGLSPEEIVDYANYLARNGFQPWEIRTRLADPKSVAA